MSSNELFLKLCIQCLISRQKRKPYKSIKNKNRRKQWLVLQHVQVKKHNTYNTLQLYIAFFNNYCYHTPSTHSGLSLRAGDRAFPPAIINMNPGSFHGKMEPKDHIRHSLPHLLISYAQQLDILMTALTHCYTTNFKSGCLWFFRNSFFTVIYSVKSSNTYLLLAFYRSWIRDLDGRKPTWCIKNKWWKGKRASSNMQEMWTATKRT